MIRHIVILDFKKSSIDYLALMEMTRPLITQIPGIISYSLYRNESTYTPLNTVSLGVEILFEDKQALDVFMTHPKHFEANVLFVKYLSDPGYMVLTNEI